MIESILVIILAVTVFGGYLLPFPLCADGVVGMAPYQSNRAAHLRWARSHFPRFAAVKDVADRSIGNDETLDDMH